MNFPANRTMSSRVVWTFLVIFLFGAVSTASAENLTKSGMQSILDESIKALLTGQPFDPALEKQQQSLRKMFEAGAVSKAQLIAMVESSMMPIMDAYQEKASIEGFKALPERVEALLAPYMSWQEVKAAGWRIASPLINESIKDLLTGQPFRPALEKKQLVVRKMFEAGLITKPECIEMVKGAMLPILEQCKTSRYILKEIPERVEALLFPYMTWEEVEAVAWEMGASLIDDGEQMVLNIATLAPPGTPWLDIPKRVLLPRIAELSDNKVIVKVYGGGVMGEDTDILRKMDIGQLNGCGCTALGILAASPETSALLLPGLFNNYDEVDYILKTFRKRIDQSFEKQGYILGALIDTGFFYLFTKNPVTCLDDLKNQKPLTWFGDVETAFYKALDVSATPVAVPETISALSMDMANANLAPAAWMLGMQAYQYARYYYAQPFIYSPGAILVSVATKEKLRKRFGVSETLAYNVQEMLIYEVSQLEPLWKKEARAFEAKTLEAFQSKCGMKPVPLSAADQERLARAADAVNEKLAGKVYPRELMNDIQTSLAAYRSGEQQSSGAVLAPPHTGQ
ncbi:MAG: TRAP transporter substrate-binding protein DctP [Thermodesulfobacteriota bacterium]|nr:TRAP transporter substrate-binding protein DctP [Thermodesulfobacteriota bacterium]